jgi:hypothetical protein
LFRRILKKLLKKPKVFIFNLSFSEDNASKIIKKKIKIPIVVILEPKEETEFQFK